MILTNDISKIDFATAKDLLHSDEVKARSYLLHVGYLDDLWRRVLQDDLSADSHTDLLIMIAHLQSEWEPKYNKTVAKILPKLCHLVLLESLALSDRQSLFNLISLIFQNRALLPVTKKYTSIWILEGASQDMVDFELGSADSRILEMWKVARERQSQPSLDEIAQRTFIPRILSQSLSEETSLEIIQSTLHLIINILAIGELSRFIWILINDMQYIENLQASLLFEQIKEEVKVLHDLLYFPFDRIAGCSLTDDEFKAVQYEKINRFQKILFKLGLVPELAFAPVTSFKNGHFLERNLKMLSNDDLTLVCSAMKIKSTSRSVSFLQNHMILQSDLFDEAANYPLFPTECSKSTRFVQRLTFLLLADLILYEYQQVRHNFTSLLEEDVADICQEMDPWMSKQGETCFEGISPYAIPIATCRLAGLEGVDGISGKPLRVLIEVMVDTTRISSENGMGWRQMSTGDTIVLLCIKAGTEQGDYELKVMRGAELFSLDWVQSSSGEQEKSKMFMKLVLSYDRRQYNLDLESGNAETIFSSFNLVLRPSRLVVGTVGSAPSRRLRVLQGLLQKRSWEKVPEGSGKYLLGLHGEKNNSDLEEFFEENKMTKNVDCRILNIAAKSGCALVVSSKPNILEKLVEANLVGRDQVFRLGFKGSEEAVGTIKSYQAVINEYLSHVAVLIASWDLPIDYSFTCEAALQFFHYHVKQRWQRYEAMLDLCMAATPSDAVSMTSEIVAAFPFSSFEQVEAGDGQDIAYFVRKARSIFKDQVQGLFEKIARLRPLELLVDEEKKESYILTNLAKIIHTSSSALEEHICKGTFSQSQIPVDAVILSECEGLKVSFGAAIVCHFPTAKKYLFGDTTSLFYQ